MEFHFLDKAEAPGHFLVFSRDGLLELLLERGAQALKRKERERT